MYLIVFVKITLFCCTSFHSAIVIWIMLQISFLNFSVIVLLLLITPCQLCSWHCFWLLIHIFIRRYGTILMIDTTNMLLHIKKIYLLLLIALSYDILIPENSLSSIKYTNKYWMGWRIVCRAGVGITHLLWQERKNARNIYKSNQIMQSNNTRNWFRLNILEWIR